MKLTERLQEGLASADIVAGTIHPQVMQKGVWYYARAVMFEDITGEVVAMWEYGPAIRTKRNAWRIAKKVAKRMSLKLNKRASEVFPEYDGQEE